MNGREDVLPISWDKGEYKDISQGEALLFPINETNNQFVKVRNAETLQSFSNATYAIAYKKDDELQINIIQRIPSEASERFTGLITVSSLLGAQQYAYYYKNGQLTQEDPGGRSESVDCFWIDHQVCTTLTGGGEIYPGNCSIVSSYYFCLFTNEPPSLQADDIGDIGGVEQEVIPMERCARTRLFREFMLSVEPVCGWMRTEIVRLKTPTSCVQIHSVLFR